MYIYVKHFEFSRYKKEFGFILKDRNIMVDDIRIRGVGKSPINPSTHKNEKQKSSASKETVIHTNSNFFFLNL